MTRNGAVALLRKTKYTVTFCPEDPYIFVETKTEHTGYREVCQLSKRIVTARHALSHSTDCGTPCPLALPRALGNTLNLMTRDSLKKTIHQVSMHPTGTTCMGKTFRYAIAKTPLSLCIKPVNNLRSPT